MGAPLPETLKRSTFLLVVSQEESPLFQGVNFSESYVSFRESFLGILFCETRSQWRMLAWGSQTNPSRLPLLGEEAHVSNINCLIKLGQLRL